MGRKLNVEKVKEAIAKSESLAGTLKILGLYVGGANYKTIHNFIKIHKIDTTHWKGQAIWRGKKLPYTKAIPLSKILVINSTYTSTSGIKRKLLKEDKILNKCYTCGQEPIWNGKLLVMVLDHINGINNDNRLENLRLLCPNCNSQQATFAGRNKNKWIVVKDNESNSNQEAENSET